MSVQEVDDDGNLWFLSASDSHKNHELSIDPSVKLYFQDSAHSDFLYLEGSATVSHDKAKIKELWKFIIKTWFTEGEDDPRIRVIKVSPRAGSVLFPYQIRRKSKPKQIKSDSSNKLQKINAARAAAAAKTLARKPLLSRNLGYRIHRLWISPDPVDTLP